MSDLCYDVKTSGKGSAMPADLVSVLSLDLPAFVIGIGIHEFMHAFVADRLGDKTPREQGRVNLNPIEHLDPIGTILPLYLSLVGSPMAFGWGKPVEIDPRNFKNPDRGYGMVALAGPLGNLAVCFIVGLSLHWAFGSPWAMSAATNPAGNYVFRLLFKVFTLNLGLFLFNLIPIPPLDGSKVLMWLGGKPVREKFEQIQPYSLFLLMGFLMLRLDQVFLTKPFVMITVWFTGMDMAPYVFMPARFVADFL